MRDCLVAYRLLGITPLLKSIPSIANWIICSSLHRDQAIWLYVVCISQLIASDNINIRANVYPNTKGPVLISKLYVKSHPILCFAYTPRCLYFSEGILEVKALINSPLGAVETDQMN